MHEVVEPTRDAETNAKNIDELLQRKAQIIARKIDSDTAAKGAIGEIQMINAALVHLGGTPLFHQIIIVIQIFSC